jgi:hypothetical protein
MMTRIASDRVPWPTKEYMRSLAEAVYAVASLEGFILGDLPRLSSPPSDLERGSLSTLTLGVVAGRYQTAADETTDPAEKAWLEACAALLEVVEPRNQTIHAHPATIDEEQMLCRWAAATTRKQALSKRSLGPTLTHLTELATDHSTRLYGLRLPERS